jgi:hypothetical protein
VTPNNGPTDPEGGPTVDDFGSVALVTSLARVWSAIRKHHPDVPGVVLLPAPNPHRQTNVLGHFAALRWSARKDNGAAVIHEVVVVAEHLNRSAEDVVETLLHEAAHAMNFARGRKDCSASQYHNRVFKAAAEEVGLTVIQMPHYGFAQTRLTHETVMCYAIETADLATALMHRRSHGSTAKPPSGSGEADGEDRHDQVENPDLSKGRMKKAKCPCGFIVRVSRKVLGATTISCGRCVKPFELA